MTTDPAPDQRWFRERAWVERLRGGDDTAFEEIFQAYYARLCAFAQQFIRSPDAAEDVVAEVFFQIWRHRKRGGGGVSLRAYLYTAVRNQALKQVEHGRVADRWRAMAAASAAAEPPGAGASPETDIDAATLEAAIEQAIARLPDRPREAYLLCRRHGLSYAEVAVTMGISVKTVENHIGRALRTLRDLLSHWLS